MTTHSGDFVDVHAHYFGGVVHAWINSFGGMLTGGYQIPEWTIDGALAFMDRHRIATQVLSMPLPFRGVESPRAFAREINEEYANLIAQHPKRFGAFATIPWTNEDDALEELRYALDVLRLDGVLMLSNAGGAYLSEPGFEPVLAELSRRETPVFLHPAECPHLNALCFGRTGAIVEYPFDTARTLTDALYQGVFRKYPGLQIIAAHGGGALPTLARRIAVLLPIGKGPHDVGITEPEIRTTLAGLYYETALASSLHSLLPILQVTTTDHILFGSDYPAAPEDAIIETTQELSSSSALTPETLASISWKNAFALFPRFTEKGSI